MRWIRWAMLWEFLTTIVTRLQAQTTPPPIGVAADADTAMRIVISVQRRRLWVFSGASDTVFVAPVAVGSGRTLRAGARSWTFDTPLGVHRVLSKDVDPIWVRPDWAYIEVARKHGFRVVYLDASRPRTLSDGSKLVVRGQIVGVLDGETFTPLPIDEEIVFDDVLYVPPLETQSRRVAGTLGRYRLNLGNGIGLHGTTDVASIGRAVTHGCVRLADEDIEWLYTNVPVGTVVYIY